MIPQTKPFYHAVIPTPAGGVWVVPVAPDLDRRVVDMFDANGAYEGSAVLPAPMVIEVAPVFLGDLLVVVLKRQDGVEVVSVLRRSRSAGSAYHKE